MQHRTLHIIFQLNIFPHFSGSVRRTRSTGRPLPPLLNRKANHPKALVLPDPRPLAMASPLSNARYRNLRGRLPSALISKHNQCQYSCVIHPPRCSQISTSQWRTSTVRWVSWRGSWMNWSRGGWSWRRSSETTPTVTRRT